jgi:hypothetical protein
MSKKGGGGAEQSRRLCLTALPMTKLTKTRSVTMTQMAPMVSRIMKKTTQMKCVPFVESLGGTMSYGFDVCRVRDEHMKNVVEKTPRRNTFVISVSNNVLQLLSKPTQLSKTVSAVTLTHRVMPLSVVFFFFSSSFSN